MKAAKDKKDNEVPVVTIDPSLDQYRDKNLFPEKLAKANVMLKTATSKQEAPQLNWRS